jgi:hypothetical protein
MKTFKSLFFFLILATISSCGVGEAEDIGEEFHKKLDAQDYDYIVNNMIDSEALAATSKEAWFSLFADMQENWGTPSKREKDMGFKSNYDNGITNVQLDYTLTYDSKIIYERIFFADRGDGFKITGLFLNEDKDDLHEQAGELN